MLIQTAGRVCVPGVKLTGNADMHEPVLLNCLPEGLGLVGGYPAAVLGNLQQLCLAFGAGFFRGHLFGKVSVAVGKDYDGITVDSHGLQLIELAVCVHVVEEVQLGDGVFDVLLVIKEALFEYLAGAYGMAGAALLHELGKYAGLICQLPFGGHGVYYLVTGAAVLPVGDDDLFLQLHVLFGNGEVDKVAVIHNLHILQGMAAQLGEGGGSLGGVALFAYDKLAIGDLDALALKVVLEGGGSHFGYGHGAVIQLVCLGHELCALHVDVGLGLNALLAQHLYPCVHSAFFHFLFILLSVCSGIRFV